MNLDHVAARRFAPVEQRYGWRDCALYALALGIGSDPLDADELPYVYEGGPGGLRVVPSWCVTLGWPPFWQAEAATGIDWHRILHGELSFVLHRPMPLEATVRATHRIAGIEDKGRDRGALIHFDTELHDAVHGHALASIRSVQFLRGDGGSGANGERRPALPPLAAGPPSLVVDYRTPTQAALLYRLASNDLIPLHADPEIARRAGFERPFSHGLNTLGLVCRAILKRLAPGRPERLVEMAARFARPAFPGDTIRIELFTEDQGAHGFRAIALERGVVVLDRGRFRLGPT